MRRRFALFWLGMVLGGFIPLPAKAVETGTAQVLVGYFSRTGNTEQMARGVADGVKRVPGAIPILKKVQDISKKDLETV